MTSQTETADIGLSKRELDPALSNSLVDLAARIKSQHEAVVSTVKRGLEHAMMAGDLLFEAKAQVKHGQWQHWLSEHCGIPARTATHYMRLARNRQTIEQIGNVADLTVRSAVELLAPASASDDRADDDEGDEPLPPLADGEIEIPIDQVKFRPELYLRLAVKPELVDRYRHFLPDLPAIEVNQRNELIDGWHRWEAHRQAGSATIRARVTDVANDLEHFRMAIKRNARHGLQLPIESELQARDERKRKEKLDKSISRAVAETRD